MLAIKFAEISTELTVNKYLYFSCLYGHMAKEAQKQEYMTSYYEEI